VKRSRDRDDDPNQGQRDEAAKGPLWVEPIAPPHSERARYGLPLLIVAFVVLALTVAMITRYANYFGGGAEPTTSPAGPTPITWVDAKVMPSSLATPFESAAVTGSASASAGTTTGMPATTPAAITLAPPTPVASQLITSIRATIDPIPNTWYLGTENHFTLELTNTSPVAVYMSPCPIYRMYITGTDPAAATLRLLNCLAIGDTLEPGQSVSLDMVYIPTTSDPRGPNQQLVWEWVAPDNIQAMTTATVYIMA
jgi:hypothetical protein